jgi:hypothetical protein
MKLIAADFYLTRSKCSLARLQLQLLALWVQSAGVHRASKLLEGLGRHITGESLQRGHQMTLVLTGKL